MLGDSSQSIASAFRRWRFLQGARRGVGGLVPWRQGWPRRALRQTGTPRGQRTWAVHYAMHDALFKPIRDNALSPSPATRWSESADGLSSAFAWRQSVRGHREWQRIAIMVALILLIGGGVEVARADEGTPAAGASGLIGAINPETGQIGPPTAEQLQHLRMHLQRVYASKITPRAPVKLPNGATMAVLGPEALSFVVTRRNPDGTRSTTCVSTMQDAVRFWSTPGTQPHHGHQQESHHALR